MAFTQPGIQKYRGRDFLVKRGQGDGPPETFTTIGGMRSTALKINNSPIDTTDKQDAPWRTIMPGGIKSMSIDLQGTYAADAQLRAVQAAIFSTTNGDTSNFQLIAGNLDKFTGAFFIASLDRTGTYNGEELYTVKLESSGLITFAAGP